MTQSGVSQAIKCLEDALGLQLLARGRNGALPNEIGRAVITDAREAILAIERMQQKCAARKGEHRGQLRIGSVQSASMRLLPPKLAAYQERHRNIDITLMEGTDAEVCEWVENAVVEIGLTAVDSPTTRASLLAEDDFLLVLRRDHRLARRRSVTLREIASEPFLMSASGCEPAIRQIFARANVSPRIAFHVRDAAALVKMAAQGLGVTLMPALAIPENAPGVSRVRLEPRSRRRLLLVTRRDRDLSPVAEGFYQMLVGRARRPAARSVTRAM
jgi:DNA-binding transcriptional LysR family regulator